MQTDEALILRARNGDREAFEMIVRRYDQRVLTTALGYTQNAAEAQDIYQEVFLRVYRSLASFQFRSQFATWLHRVVINVCHSQGARRNRQPRISLDSFVAGEDDESPGIELIDEKASTEAEAMSTEIAADVRAAIEKLSPRQRSVFVLRHFEDMKLREIAEVMDCAEGTVKRHLFAATQRLREQLEGWTARS